MIDFDWRVPSFRHTVLLSILAVAATMSDAASVQGQFAGKANGTSGSNPVGFSSDARFGDRPGRGSDRSGRAPHSLQIVLREGTVIGPLRGRFVVRGQRWKFLPEQTITSGDMDHARWIAGGSARKILPDQDTMLGRQRKPSSSLAVHPPSANPLGASQRVTSSASDPAPNFESMLVIENLMLERIARAIGEDPQDDYWTVTASVTEFQDQNRLMVLTANRSRRQAPQ